MTIVTFGFCDWYWFFANWSKIKRYENCLFSVRLNFIKGSNMNKLKTIILLFSGLLCMSSPAFAQNVSSYVPETIVKALNDAGYQSKLTKSDDGNPEIETAVSGNDFIIAFTACESGKKCKYLEIITVASCEDMKDACAAAVEIWQKDENLSGARFEADLGAIIVYYYMILGKEGVSKESLIATIEYVSDDMNLLSQSAHDLKKK